MGAASKEMPSGGTGSVTVWELPRRALPLPAVRRAAHKGQPRQPAETIGAVYNFSATHLLHRIIDDPGLSRPSWNYRRFGFERDLLRALKIIWRCSILSALSSWIRRKQEWGVTWETCAKPIGSTGGTPCSPASLLRDVVLFRDIQCYHLMNTYARCLSFNGGEAKGAAIFMKF